MELQGLSAGLQLWGVWAGQGVQSYRVAKSWWSVGGLGEGKGRGWVAAAQLPSRARKSSLGVGKGSGAQGFL